MTRGYDSPQLKQYFYTNQYIISRLCQIQEKAHNLSWLEANEAENHKVIHDGLQVKQLYQQTVDTLLTITPHMLSLPNYRRWSALLNDSLLSAWDLRDYSLLTTIYTLLGQSHVIAGEIKPARWMFDTVLEYALEKQSDEMKLLAYIGLFKTQSYLMSDDFTPALVSGVMRLAYALDDDWHLASLHFTLALAYNYRTDTISSLGHAQMAFAYWHRLNRKFDLFRVCVVLAIAYRLDHHLALAETFLDRANTVLPPNDHSQSNVVFLIERASLYRAQKRYQDAEQGYRRALKLCHVLDLAYHAGLAWYGLGIIQIHRFKFDKARLNLKSALRTWEKLQNVHERIKVTLAMGCLEAESGHPHEAIDWLHQAADLCHQDTPSDALTKLRAEIDETLARVLNGTYQFEDI